MRLLLSLFLLAGLNVRGAQAPTGPALLISGATVIDGTGAGPRQADVLVRGDRIVAVGAPLDTPAGTRVIDATGQTLLPGLFDLHTHLSAATAGRLSADWGKNLKAYLYCGITSVADLGNYGETFAPARQLLESGAVEGPRIAHAARLTTPGGHGAEGGRSDLYSLEVLTAREGRAAIQRVLPYHPDAIKVFTDGWRYGTAPDMTSMEEDTLAAIVDEAHKAGLPVLTHTVTLERAKIAARAGVDVIAHGIGDAYADQELGQLMQRSHTMYVSTLAVYEWKPRGALPPLLAAVLEPQALASLSAPAGSTVPSAARRKRWDALQHNIGALRGMGVTFGAGTDAGMPGTHHGFASLHELELLVQGGLTPLEAITAATGNSARALRVDAARGTIAPGKLADLVLVAGAPDRNIEDLRQVRRVFLGGREIDREKLRRDIAAPGATPLPAVAAREKIDDFEDATGRSSLGTVWINGSDSGHDRSRVSFTRTLRAPGDHALTAVARMAEKDRPYVRVIVPLTPGAVQPMDASGFAGIEFEARGEGEYRLIAATYGLRDGAPFQARFGAGAAWQRVRIPFAELKRPGRPEQTNGTGLESLGFELARPPSASAWLELDNLRFYK